MHSYPHVVATINGITSMTPRQLAITLQAMPAHYQDWIRSINDLIEECL